MKLQIESTNFKNNKIRTQLYNKYHLIIYYEIQKLNLNLIKKKSIKRIKSFLWNIKLTKK